jgi:hypothetical protein
MRHIRFRAAAALLPIAARASPEQDAQAHADATDANMTAEVRGSLYRLSLRTDPVFSSRFDPGWLLFPALRFWVK